MVILELLIMASSMQRSSHAEAGALKLTAIKACGKRIA
jgi:hypothetical protein